MRTEKNMINKIVLSGVMMALVTVMTMVIQIPVPATNGYIHLGDTMIFFSVLLLGYKYGAVVSGVGSALADLLTGYVQYAPITLVVKALMAVAMGIFIGYAINKNFSKAVMKLMEIIGMVIAGFVMVAGYYLAESFMVGNFITPIAAIPMNIVQFVSGVVFASILATALSKTSAKNMFYYEKVV